MRSIPPPVLVLAFSIVALTVGPQSANAQVADDRRLAPVREAVETERKRQEIPGLSIAVVVDDQLVWSEGFGVADLESGVRATGSTVYRIGSISKPVVATALMQLHERGLVDLDDDVRKFVPELPEKRWPIRVRHLLTHTSGIRHYGDPSEFLSARRYEDLIGPLEIWKDDPLLFEPGSKFSYSTFGFNVVANVVERASGEPIGEYMRRRVYAPAWMNATALEDKATVQTGRAGHYRVDGDGKLINAPYVDLSNKYAGGGITSTVEDLARFHIAHARGRLLRPETIETMLTRHRLADGSEIRFGLGWVVARREVAGRGERWRLVGHSGGSIGACALLHRYPDRGFAVAILANREGRDLKPIMATVTEALAPRAD